MPKANSKGSKDTCITQAAVKGATATPSRPKGSVKPSVTGAH